MDEGVKAMKIKKKKIKIIIQLCYKQNYENTTKSGIVVKKKKVTWTRIQNAKH